MSPPIIAPQIAAKTKVLQSIEFSIFDGGVNEYPFAQSEVRQRGNIDLLPKSQVEELREAMRRTVALNSKTHDRRRYFTQALVHQNHCQHGWERFLPWHRAYMYVVRVQSERLQPQCHGALLGLDHGPIYACAA